MVRRNGSGVVWSLGVLLLGLLPGVMPARAQQTGKITGVVVDAGTGETLIGANVVLDGTTTGATTDLDGRYTIERVPPGTYTLVFSYLGFRDARVEGVEVKAGAVTRVDMSLVEEAVEVGGEVVVEARALRNNDAVLLKDRAKAIAVSDAISARAMAQAGAGDAAEAMSRVTGASVVGGKYVYVRGLGGRYGNAQLNGATLPSADPDRNAAQFDLFPANLLDNIVATKTFTPDQPGSFTGGNVNLRTKDFPERFGLQLTTTTGYNTRASLKDDFLSGPRSDTDWLGFDDGLRALPSLLQSPGLAIPRPTQARRDPALAAQLDQLTRAFNPVMVPVPRRSGLDLSYAASLGTQMPVFGRALGVVASATYSRGFKAYDGGRVAQFVLTDPSAEELFVDYDLADRQGTESVNWGVLANLTYKLHPHHQVGVNLYRSQVSDHEARYAVGPFPKNSPETVRFETYVLRYTERGVRSGQLRGEHFLRPVRIDWMASVAGTRQEEPDLRFFFDQFVDVVREDTTFRVYDLVLGSSNATPPTRLFRDLEEENREMQLNVEVPVDLGLAAPVKLKTGGAYLKKDRTFRERKFDYVEGSVPFRVFNGDVNAYFGPDNIGILEENNGRFVFGNTIRDGSIAANNYDGTQEVAAAYAMAEVPVTRRLRLIGGARYEAASFEIVSRDSTKAPGRLDDRDGLPSLNVVYALQDNMNLRLSATRTLARPTFREKAPFSAFDFAGGRQTAGNPDLQRTLINNYDVRWEWFMRPGEVLAVSGFYKYFKHPIERVVISNNDQETYQNVPRARVAGVEFEVRKLLDFVALPVVRRMTVSTNLALIHSETDVPERELAFAEGFDIGTTRPFQGQSPYVFNLTLAYDHLERGTSVSVSFNRFGKRLARVSIGGTPNIFEFGRNDLNLVVKQRLVGNVDARFAVANLLDDDYVEGQEYNGRRFEARRYRLGVTYKLSLTYNL
ncbi:MAG: outer membrane protein [Rhodothermaceae bacterium]|nr:MAG: outer membrane protein [Rhodothermaceae bacterium]